ncbi:coilin isoform X2 [Lingula anatina]|uniref:Coilin isoform X2 n=1 Tax=Lingula anatina TaxID=7574 RepID=A0A1S3HR98_LINAN|nr:coilin isoform X2 [Lingula anatina]|eukprot:XP_013388565.1 coilin isoform X2 [Lingula anatina]
MAASTKNVRVKLSFKNVLLSENHLPGIYWYLVEPQTHPTVTHMIRDLKSKFNLEEADLVLKVEDCVIPTWESTKIFRENDTVDIKCSEKQEQIIIASCNQTWDENSLKKKKKKKRTSVERSICKTNVETEDTLNAESNAKRSAIHENSGSKRKSSDVDTGNIQSISEADICESKKKKADSEYTDNHCSNNHNEGKSSGEEADEAQAESTVGDNSNKKRRKRKRHRKKNNNIIADQAPNQVCPAGSVVVYDSKMHHISKNGLKDGEQNQHIVFDTDDEMTPTCESTDGPSMPQNNQILTTDSKPAQSPEILSMSKGDLVSESLDKQNKKHDHFSAIPGCDIQSVPLATGSSPSHLIVTPTRSTDAQVNGKQVGGFQVFDRRKQKAGFYEMTKEQQLRSTQTNSSVIMQNGATPKDVLELSEDYTPVVSKYKEACVLDYSPSDTVVKLELLTKTEKKNYGRFDLVIEDESEVFTNIPTENVVLIRLAEMLEPKLIPTGP